MSGRVERRSAADWVVRRDSKMSAAEIQAYEAWLAADPRNGPKLERLAATWSLLERPRRTGGADAVLRELAARRRSRLWRQWAAGAGMAAAAAAMLVWSLEHKSRGDAAAAGAVADNRTVERVLPDGSIVDLRAGARISVAFTPAVRRVSLDAGQVLFEVVKNRQWPFVVGARGVEVRAVGTAFSVDLGERNVEILVSEGRVAVGRAEAAGAKAGPPASAPTMVDAGHRALVDAKSRSGRLPRVTRLSQAQMAQRLAWGEPRLEFSGTPLPDAVALLNRHNQVQLVIGDAALRKIKLSGYIRAGNVEGFVDMLEGAFGIRAEQRAKTELRLERAP